MIEYDEDDYYSQQKASLHAIEMVRSDHFIVELWCGKEMRALNECRWDCTMLTSVPYEKCEHLINVALKYCSG